MSKYNKAVYPTIVNVLMLGIGAMFGEEVAANPEVAAFIAAAVNLAAIMLSPANKEPV